jgi:homoserine dehydrogenase
MSGTVVLKLGGSILDGPEALAAASLEVYREVRAGYRVIAVVSAFRGRTDALAALARRLAPGALGRSHCALLATGEAEATAALALQLDGDGVPAECIEGHRLAIRTRGDAADGEPVAVDRETVLAALERVPVVVVPGFVGVDGQHGTTLLGRGGSDLTALFLARELGARCRLVKDVDGWFERDPAAPGPAPARRTRLSWEDALTDGAPVVQPKAVALARGWGQEFAVGALGTARPTLVGAGPTRLESAPSPAPPLRVALLGLGTVGGGVYEHLAAQPLRYRIVSVLVRDPERPRDVDHDPELVTDDPERAFALGCDVMVELIGGVGDARRYVLDALHAGCHVVTANKLLLAEHGPELERTAAAAGRRLLGSAAVGGAVPMLEAVERMARFPGVRAFRGVLNGTTNFVLDRLADGLDFDRAVAAAQELGFAEADPRADLSGADAAAKAVLLARAATGRSLGLQEVAVQGIEDPAVLAERPAEGERIRLVARFQVADDGEVRLSVGPERVAAADPLGSVRDEENVLVVTGADGSEQVVRGRGAGRRPTAIAVVADLEELRLQRALQQRGGAGLVAEGAA